jgi:hypothetical protein
MLHGGKLEDEQGIAIGRGGFWLDLNEGQYQLLRRIKGWSR